MARMKSTGKKVYVAEVRGGMGITVCFCFLRNPSMRDVENAVNDLLDSDDEYPKYQLDTRNWEGDFIAKYYGLNYDEPFNYGNDEFQMFELDNVMIHISSDTLIDNKPQI